MSAPQLTRKRIFCLEETLWWPNGGLNDRTSVLPALELLHQLGTIDEFAHRHVAGRTDFARYLELRGKGRITRTCGTIYLAFHGSKRGLHVGEDEPIDLKELAVALGSVPGAVVHLGSCSVLRSRQDQAEQFLRDTKARAISGYESDVDFLDSAALDIAWLGHLAAYKKVGDAHRALEERYSSLIDHLTWTAFPAR